MKRARRFRLPAQPRNPAELELLTKWYFGKELHVRAWVDGNGAGYKVAEKFDDYHGTEWLFPNHEYGYDERFWRCIFGALSCGGVATHSYGQTRLPRKSYRLKKRLCNWNRKDSHDVRPIFVRLAAQPRGRREWPDSR